MTTLLAHRGLSSRCAGARCSSSRRPPAIGAAADISVNPTASSVKEDQLLQQLNASHGRGTIPDQKSYTIEQPAGRDWRHFHEVTLRWIGAIAILGMLVLLVVFYLIRGMVRIESGRSGPRASCASTPSSASCTG